MSFTDAPCRDRNTKRTRVKLDRQQQNDTYNSDVVLVMRGHNINGVPCKDYTTWTLNLTLTLILVITRTVTHYCDNIVILLARDLTLPQVAQTSTLTEQCNPRLCNTVENIGKTATELTSQFIFVPIHWNIYLKCHDFFIFYELFQIKDSCTFRSQDHSSWLRNSTVLAGLRFASSGKLYVAA